MSNYQEITNLKNLYSKHNINFVLAKVHPDFNATENVWIEFTVDDYNAILLVDDEFKDFSAESPILNLCLVLRELETYREEEDILRWTVFKNLSPSNPEVLNYYKDLGTLNKEIKAILGKIDSQISDFDFELNAGAAQELRRLGI